MSAIRGVLRDARLLVIVPERWEQGEPTDRDCYCARTAIARASYLFDESDDAADDAAARLFERANGIPFAGIPAWNDDRARTHADILAGFDAAVALAESEAA